MQYCPPLTVINASHGINLENAICITSSYASIPNLYAQVSPVTEMSDLRGASDRLRDCVAAINVNSVNRGKSARNKQPEHFPSPSQRTV